MLERPSMRFNKFQKSFKSEGTCELNDRGALLTEKGNELEYDEEAIYTQFYDTKVTKKSW